jgi:capsular exopolysaccharide synthesis family protein
VILRETRLPQPKQLAEDSLLLVEPAGDLDLGEYGRVLRRHWRLVAVSAAIGIAAAVLHYVVSPRQYRATTTLHIERGTLMAAISPDLVQVGAESPSSAFHRTQYELLRSRALAERVVKRLDLALEPLFFPGRLRLGTAARPSAGRDGAALAALGDCLLDDLQVEPATDTYLVRVSYLASDPGLAATVVNTLADEFIAWGIETRYHRAERASNFLTAQIAALKQEVSDKEKQLVTYSRTSDVVAPDLASTPSLQRLQAMNRDYIEAVSRRIDKGVRNQELLDAPPQRIAEAVSGEVLSQRRRELSQQEQDYAVKLGTYRPEWPAMVELRAEIEKARQHLQSMVVEMAAQARGAARAEYQVALRREQTIASELQALKEDALQQSSTVVEYGNLKVEISTRRELLDELLRRQAETDTASRSVSRDSDVRVVDPAVAPQRAFRPALRLDLSYGLGLGLLLGLGTVFLREHLDRTLKDREAVERTLGLPVLAVVPELGDAVTTGDSYGYRARRHGLAKGRGPSLVERRPAPAPIERLPQTRPRLAASEAYRALRTALLLSSAGELRVVAVTSAHPKEGKTATACNLAVVMAQLGRQVLLIDGDLRVPRLHQIFGLSNHVGLVTHLTSGGDAAQMVQRTEMPGLYLCPSGPLPPNPSELLSSERMARLLALVSTRFDFVVVDTPPVLVVTDASLIGSLVDGMVLCLRAGRVVRKDAVACCERLRLTEAKLLGAVLNGCHGVEPSHDRYYAAYEEYRGGDPMAGAAS